MRAVDDGQDQDLEKGLGTGSASPNGEIESSIKEKKMQRRATKWLHKKKRRLTEWLVAEKVNQKKEWREDKRIWTVAIAILPCNATVITTMPTTDGSFAQAVMILATLSFVISLILIIAPIAMPAVGLAKVKQIVLVSVGFFTGCSFLAYVGMQMGPIARTTAAAIFFAGACVFSLSVLFLIRTVFGAPSRAIESPLPLTSQPLLTGARPPPDTCTQTS